MRCVVASLLAGLLVGCSGTTSSTETALVDEPPLYFDPAFSVAEMWLWLDAQARWDTIARPWSGDGWRVVKENPPLNGAGYTDRPTRTIFIRPTLLPRYGQHEYLNTAMHELGHARGLEHTRDGVMEGTEGVVKRVTTVFSSEDLAECRRVGACPRN